MINDDNKLCIRDMDDKLTQAMFDERERMRSKDWVELTEGVNHPIAWYCDERTSVEEYRVMQTSIGNAIIKTRHLLNQTTLSEDERRDLESFLKLLGAYEGPIKFKDRVHYFVHRYLPWVHFAKELFFDRPYSVFFTSWAAILINAVVLAIVFSAWPIFNTFAVSLLLTIGLTFAVMGKDRVLQSPKEYRLQPMTRFFAMLPIILILWGSLAAVSILGQLPVGAQEAPQLVVSRDGTVQRVISINDRFMRFPNAWEAIIRGDSLSPLPKDAHEDNLTYAIPALNKGQLAVTVAIRMQESAKLVGTDFNALPREREGLLEQARNLAAGWCNNYREGQTNPSLAALLNQLATAHFTVQASPVKITWIEEKMVPTEKVTATTVTTTKEEKVTIAEKVTTPRELWAQ